MEVMPGAESTYPINTSFPTKKSHLTEANLNDEKYVQGINQLKSAVECKSLTKGEAGIHVIGSLVLKCYRQEQENFVVALANTLNEAVCHNSATSFQAGLQLGPSAQKVLESFATEKGIEVSSAGWLELVDDQGRQTDKRLLGVFVFPNGRRGVGVFQVLN